MASTPYINVGHDEYSILPRLHAVPSDLVPVYVAAMRFAVNPAAPGKAGHGQPGYTFDACRCFFYGGVGSARARSRDTFMPIRGYSVDLVHRPSGKTVASGTVGLDDLFPSVRTGPQRVESFNAMFAVLRKEYAAGNRSGWRDSRAFETLLRGAALGAAREAYEERGGQVIVRRVRFFAGNVVEKAGGKLTITLHVVDDDLTLCGYAAWWLRALSIAGESLRPPSDTIEALVMMNKGEVVFDDVGEPGDASPHGRVATFRYLQRSFFVPEGEFSEPAAPELVVDDAASATPPAPVGAKQHAGGRGASASVAMAPRVLPRAAPAAPRVTYKPVAGTAAVALTITLPLGKQSAVELRGAALLAEADDVALATFFPATETWKGTLVLLGARADERADAILAAPPLPGWPKFVRAGLPSFGLDFHERA